MTDSLGLAELRKAADEVHETLQPTLQAPWPLLCERIGAEVWLKHENHLPVGSFKVRGGVLLLRRLRQEGVERVVAATRGNHGQSVAFAARRCGIEATIVVPAGNSVSKNRSMRALGATLVEHGRDFQAALEHARALTAGDGATLIPSFSLELVRGVASYALELFEAAGRLDAVYVPIGLGSGICGVAAVRDALGLRTEIVGVVAARANCYALSLAAGRAVSTPTADTVADGLACRVPDDEALAYMRSRVARTVEVGEAEIRAAMRHLFADTGNAAEGAGAAALAGALKERDRLRGRRVGLVLSGGNVDPVLSAEVLREAQAA